MIALYARVSTQEQALHGSSIEEQHSRMRSYCDALGWEVYKVYTDAGFSGSNTHRPALQELLRAVSEHKVDKVLVYKLDRLSRSQRDTLELIEDHFLANGVDFVSMSENFDTSAPIGKAMVGILAVFAQLEREQIKERMMMGRQARAKKGKYNGSRTDPIGYDYVDGSLVINEYEALQIRRIYDLFLGGMSRWTSSAHSRRRDSPRNTETGKLCGSGGSCGRNSTVVMCPLMGNGQKDSTIPSSRRMIGREQTVS